MKIRKIWDLNILVIVAAGLIPGTVLSVPVGAPVQPFQNAHYGYDQPIHPSQYSQLPQYPSMPSHDLPTTNEGRPPAYHEVVNPTA